VVSIPLTTELKYYIHRSPHANTGRLEIQDTLDNTTRSSPSTMSDMRGRFSLTVTYRFYSSIVYWHRANYVFMYLWILYDKQFTR